MTAIPPCIEEKFKGILNTRCWCVCNADKIPIRAGTNDLLQWGQHPEHLLTFHELRGFADQYPGFGIICGEMGSNMLRFVDLDECLNDQGAIINPTVKEFLDAFKTWVEKSVRGKGLHALFEYPKPFDEFGINKNICGGKVYSSRFLRLTGDTFGEYDYLIQFVSDREFEGIKRIGEQRIQPADPTVRRTFTGEREAWGIVLADEGIPCLPAGYDGRERHGKIIIESWKIPCPNRAKHSDHGRYNDFSADAAILCRYNDGSSSLTCNHNACDPGTRPNLLRLLWTEIRRNRAERTRGILKEMGLIT